jgi:hypothetical protein
MKTLNAAIYNFSDGATLFATLEISELNTTQYNFNLSFLNTTASIGANHYIRLLGVDNANGIDGTVSGYTASPVSTSVAPTIATTSGFAGTYDFDFVFSSATGAANRLGVGDSASWTTSFVSAPGSFNFFQLQTVNTQGNGALNTVGSLVQAVPEPETYAMFLAGLGLLGFASRRKQA